MCFFFLFDIETGLIGRLLVVVNYQQLSVKASTKTVSYLQLSIGII